jgi:hypothetical protein
MVMHNARAFPYPSGAKTYIPIHKSAQSWTTRPFAHFVLGVLSLRVCGSSGKACNSGVKPPYTRSHLEASAGGVSHAFSGSRSHSRSRCLLWSQMWSVVWSCLTPWSLSIVRNSLLVALVNEAVTRMEYGYIVYILHIALLKVGRYTETLA